MKNLGGFLVGTLSSLWISAYLVAWLKKKWRKIPVRKMKIREGQGDTKVIPKWYQIDTKVVLAVLECVFLKKVTINNF